MLPGSCWALLLLLAAPPGADAWLGFGKPPEEIRTPPELRTPPEGGDPPKVRTSSPHPAPPMGVRQLRGGESHAAVVTPRLLPPSDVAAGVPPPTSGWGTGGSPGPPRPGQRLCRVRGVGTGGFRGVKVKGGGGFTLVSLFPPPPRLRWEHPWVLPPGRGAALLIPSEEEEEEEAAELGVDLFHCQGSAEGRQPYPHTPGTGRCRDGAPDETLVAGGQDQVAQPMEDTREGNVSSCGATWLRDGHQAALSSLHQAVLSSLHQAALSNLHQAALSNLHQAQERARDICSQLESHLALLLLQQHQVEEVMEKLRQANQSLGLMLVAVEKAQNRLEEHLQQLHGQSPSAISTCVLHGSCFVLLVTLLGSTPPRVTLLLLFLASRALGELLGVPALPVLLDLAVAGQWLVVATRRGAGGAWTVLPQEEPHCRLTSTPKRDHELKLLQEELGRVEMSYLQEPPCLEQPLEMAEDLPSLAGWASPIPGGWRTKLSSWGGMLEPNMGAGKHWETQPCGPSRSLANDMSLLSSWSPCQGLTRAGQRCRKKATPGQDFCHLHATS